MHLFHGLHVFVVVLGDHLLVGFGPLGIGRCGNGFPDNDANGFAIGQGCAPHSMKDGQGNLKILLNPSPNPHPPRVRSKDVVVANPVHGQQVGSVRQCQAHKAFAILKNQDIFFF